MILFGLFNFLGKYSLNQFALSTFLYIFFCFCLFYYRDIGSWERHTKGFGMKMLQQVQGTCCYL